MSDQADGQARYQLHTPPSAGWQPIPAPQPPREMVHYIIHLPPDAACEPLSAEMECYTLMRSDQPRVQAEEDGGPSPSECAAMIVELGERVRSQRRRRRIQQEPPGSRRTAQKALGAASEPRSPAEGAIGPPNGDNAPGPVPERGEGS